MIRWARPLTEPTILPSLTGSATDGAYQHDYRAQARLIAHYLVLKQAHPKSSDVKPQHFTWPPFAQWWGAALGRKTWTDASELGIPVAAQAALSDLYIIPSQVQEVEAKVIASASAFHTLQRLEDACTDLRERGAEALEAACEAVQQAVAYAHAGMPSPAVTQREAARSVLHQYGEELKNPQRTIVMPEPLQKICGGWVRKKVHVVVGRSSEHKTTVLRASAECAARAGYLCAGLALEDDVDDMAGRTIAAQCVYLTTRKMQTGERPHTDPDLMQRELGKAAAHIQEEWTERLWWVDDGAPRLATVMRSLRWLGARGIDWAFIDYGQLIQPDSDRAFADNTHWTKVSTHLQAIAKELNIALVVALQVDKQSTRESFAESRPPYTIDALGGACWRQNCFGSICISASNDNNGRKINFLVDKWKTGATGGGVFYVDPAHDRLIDDRSLVA